MSTFMKKISDGVNKGVATVAASSKAATEKSKIKATIGNLENERKELTLLLGQHVYDLYKQTGEISANPGFVRFVTEIDMRLELIAQKQGESKRIDEEVNLITSGTKHNAQAVCVCGHSNPTGAKFCAVCGNQQ